VKTSRKTFALVAVAAAAGLALTGCTAADAGEAGAGAQELQTVNVGIVQLSIFAPLYVADAKGYFEEEGIKLNLQNVKSGQDAIPLASSGKLDVVAAGFSAGMFSAVDSGLDVKVVASMGVADSADEPASALIVSQALIDSGEIKDLKDLKGRSIGVAGGGGATGAFYVSLALEEAGLNNSDVEFVQLSNPDMPTAIQNGSVDAAFASAPFWSNAVDQGVAKNMWEMPDGTSGTGVIYGGGFAESDLAQPFFDALVRASADLQGDAKYDDENMKIIADATGQTVEQLSAVPLYSWLPDLAPLPKQLAAMEKVWMDFGAIAYAEPLDSESYVDGSFAKASSAE
jgi:NitT/TauT family transport system substrate-binding protein